MLYSNDKKINLRARSASCMCNIPAIHSVNSEMGAASVLMYELIPVDTAAETSRFDEAPTAIVFIFHLSSKARPNSETFRGPVDCHIYRSYIHTFIDPVRVYGVWHLAVGKRQLQFTSERQEISLTASIRSPFTTCSCTTQQQLKSPATPSWHPRWR